MSNNLGDLHDCLFAQLQRLSNDDLQGEKLAEEISRSKAVTDIAATIIDNASLVLKAKIAQGESIAANKSLPKMLEGGEEVGEGAANPRPKRILD